MFPFIWTHWFVLGCTNANYLFVITVFFLMPRKSLRLVCWKLNYLENLNKTSCYYSFKLCIISMKRFNLKCMHLWLILGGYVVSRPQTDPIVGQNKLLAEIYICLICNATYFTILKFLFNSKLLHFLGFK